MACASKYEFGLFGSMYFLGVLISSLLLAPLANKFGRRPIVLVGTAIYSVTLTIILFSTSRQLTYALNFVLGLCMIMNVLVGYIYAMEFIPERRTSYTTAFLFGNDGLVMAMCAIWFMLISKEWKTLYATANVLMYATHLLVWTMPESPKFLLTKGRYNEARAVMTHIARKNGIKELKFNDKEASSLGGDASIEYHCKWEEEVAKSAS